MKRPVIVYLFIILTFSMVSCGQGHPHEPTYNLDQVDIDPRFREFYNWLGGKGTLGPAISQKFNHNGIEYQYTAAALLMFSPGAPEDQQYQLASLGLELGINEAVADRGKSQSYLTYSGFLEKYELMGGERYVGLPITDARYNPDKGRIEQYFTNLGFYHLETNPEEVGLLQYGAWKCADHCSFVSPVDAEVLDWSSAGTGFNDAIRRLNPRFTGYPLTDPYISFDGVLEQIFENVVVMAYPNNPANISLRPIPEMIGMPVNDLNHYEIQESFFHFIRQNSGLEFSGDPISDYRALSSAIYRQCFRNLCLDYYPHDTDDLSVRPVPLGYTYKRIYYLTDSPDNKTNFP